VEPGGSDRAGPILLESTSLRWAGGKVSAGPRVVARERGARVSLPILLILRTLHA